MAHELTGPVIGGGFVKISSTLILVTFNSYWQPGISTHLYSSSGGAAAIPT